MAPSSRITRSGRRLALVAALAAGLAPAVLASGAAHAQAWPAKPIRWIIPYGPGSSDIVTRMVAIPVSAALGQQLVVENRPGGNGNVGTEQVAKSPADGYTLLLGAAATHAVNPSLAKTPYDPVKDFVPIILLASVPNVLITNPSSGFGSVKDVIGAAKAKPGTVTYSSNGAGSSGHMSAALFEMLTGTKLTHVPYKGSSEAVVALARGDVNVMFANLPPAQPMIRDGRVKALAVTTSQRLGGLPELPTVAETGVPGYEVTTWFAVFAPAGTPDAIVQRLNKEFATALAMPDIREKLLQQGFVLGGGSPADLGNLVKNDLVKWAKVVKETGAKIE
jgi:tripartite-type tricarboxylate transporter receptor subunit TctC